MNKVKEYELEVKDKGGNERTVKVEAVSHTQAVLKAHDDPNVFAVKATKYETIK